MSNLNKNNVEALTTKLQALNLGNAYSMPITEGNTYHIVLPTNDTFEDWVKEQTNGWYGITTQEGITLSVQALTRTGNGLSFTRTSVAERLLELVEMADSILALRVTKVTQRNAISQEGRPQIRNYYTFEVTA